MILDASVILCIIQREPGWERHSRTLQAAEHLLISAGTLQELLIVAHCRNVLVSVEALLEVLDPDAGHPLMHSWRAARWRSTSAWVRVRAMGPS